jgi:hypothetical protein
MLVVLAIFFALFGGPNVSFHDGPSSGPSSLAGQQAAYDGASAGPDGAAFYDGMSGGPSMIAPIEPPSPDGSSGGPSHP